MKNPQAMMTSVPSDKTTPARFRPGWPVSILTLLALTVLIGLGTWQVQRLAWKNNLIETIQARSSADPIAMPEHPEAPEFNHRAVALTGYWLAATEQFVPAKTHNRELGEWLLQVLALDDGRMVLVNRGWVPLCWREATCRADEPASTVTIDGILRNDFEQGPMVPDNEPDEARWYWIDIPAIATALDIGTLEPAVVFARLGGPDGAPPVPQIPALNLRNQHLQYALTWYSLALVLLGVFGAYGLSRGRRETGDTASD
ncbi:MAG: hypothetical protein CL558_08835 [Alphaproteobacteria bacterium]|mgnify:CR=1 FL=1|nr:hypothetical protein [Alphaproteobacteria bacterium]MAS46785.1 hypothetical protein [Alphaproteobacteria bacterium]MAX94880.1 hypothetical protein [Alphaproteobacteria bacterium]MBN53667.1 hypothetical protein [Alphaproteobacteria bacterium]OUT41648.1 MAG: hypothetical protein CBB62_04790 [Micavibrio sp. TMED2]